MKTIVYQSHAFEKMRPWMQACCGSVRAWAEHIGADYKFYGDELFDLVSDQLRTKFQCQPVILADLARLRLLLAGLEEGYDRVIWLDADMLVFNREILTLPAIGHCIGREVWVQRHRGGIRSYRKVHNAFLVACKNDRFIPFYADSAESLLRRAEPPLVPQFIGPKFLTAQHNIVGLTVSEAAGMVSPLVLSDICRGGGNALRLMVQGHAGPIAAVNLAASYLGKESDGVCNTESDYEAAIDILSAHGLAV